MNVYILVSDQRTDLTIEGSLELFGQLLAAIRQVAPPERNAGESKETERRLSHTHPTPAANAAATTSGHAPAEKVRA